jgi:CRP-like cAMP-binding protein
VTPSSETIGALRRHPIWKQATDRGVRALLAHARDEKFRPGQLILRAGQPARALHLLLDGAARVFYPATDASREVTVKLFWAPAAFGDAESILRVDWAECVQALTDVRVLIIDAEKYFRVMQSEPQVCFRQYWDVARRFGVAIRSERSANVDELRDRVVALLLAYAHHFGRSDERGVVIDHWLTQDALAVEVGSNRRSVVRILGELYRRGVIARAGRRFRVPSLEKLLAISTGPTPELSFRSDDAPWAETAGT